MCSSSAPVRSARRRPGMRRSRARAWPSSTAATWPGPRRAPRPSCMHGGLRYLAMGDIGLVREAHRERRAHARTVAPHLVQPLEFVVPVGPDSPTRSGRSARASSSTARWRASRDGRNGRISLAAARRAGAAARHRGAARAPCCTTTIRPTTAALRSRRSGPPPTPARSSLTHAEVVALRIAGGAVAGAEVEDRLGGGAIGVPARAVVNAAGPWVDARPPPRGSGGRDERHSLEGRPSRPRAAATDWTAAVTTPLPGGRVSFAIPWEGMLLLGTTDEPYDGDPAAVAATDADLAQILAEAGRSLAADVLAPALVRSRFAGLRVLPASRLEHDPHAARDRRQPRGGGNGVGGRREADDVAVDRRARGAAGAHTARRPDRPDAGRWRSRTPRRSPPSSAAWPRRIQSSPATSGRTSRVTTGPRVAERARAGRRPAGAPRADPSRTAPTSGRRSSTAAITSGPRPSTTRCAGARPSPLRGLDDATCAQRPNGCSRVDRAPAGVRAPRGEPPPPRQLDGGVRRRDRDGRRHDRDRRPPDRRRQDRARPRPASRRSRRGPARAGRPRAAGGGRIALDVELKEAGYEADVLAVLHPRPAGLVVTSFLPEAVAEVRALDPASRRGCCPRRRRRRRSSARADACGATLWWRT